MLNADTAVAPPAGNVMTLLTSDVNVIGLTLPVIFTVVMLPIQLIATTALLWLQIGPYALITVGFLIFTLPVGGFVGYRIAALYDKLRTYTDTRVKLVTELINAIRVVKVVPHPHSHSSDRTV